MAGRLIFQPFIGLTNAILSASSSEITHPIRRLRDPSPASIWRSRTGWNIVAGFNDKLDFTEGSAGDATATITAGNYLTGTLLTVAIATAINAAATNNTYDVTYSTSTNKFTIARLTGSDTIGLEWSTGANPAANVGIDLGFLIAADDTGSTTYTSDAVAYHSREYVQVQTLTAVSGTFVAALGGNWLPATATVKIQANNSDAWTAPTVSETLTDALASGGPLPMWLDYFATASHTFWRLEIQDVANPIAYTEFSVFHVSSFIEPARDFRAAWTQRRSELTEMGFSDQGALFVNEKPSMTTYNLTFPAITESEKSNSFDPLLNFVKIGKPFFVSIEPDTDVLFTRYVHLDRAATYARVPGAGVWSLSLSLTEVLA